MRFKENKRFMRPVMATLCAAPEDSPRKTSGSFSRALRPWPCAARHTHSATRLLACCSPLANLQKQKRTLNLSTKAIGKQNLLR